MLTLMVSAFMIVLLNPSVVGVGSFALGTSGEPLLDGFRAIYGDAGARAARPHRADRPDRLASTPSSIAMGRQVYSLSRAGYFPTALSVTHPTYKTPHVAMIAGALRRPRDHADHLVRRWRRRAAARRRSSARCCSTWRCSARCCSYILQAVSLHHAAPQPAQYRAAVRSPLGIPGAVRDHHHRRR